MELPRVDPVGVSHDPPGFHQQPRRYGTLQRLFAGALIAAFAFVVVATTVLSLGRYCLTSDGENTRGLPHRPPVTQTR